MIGWLLATLLFLAGLAMSMKIEALQAELRQVRGEGQPDGGFPET